jgi:hypothetical protein
LKHLAEIRADVGPKQGNSSSSSSSSSSLCITSHDHHRLLLPTFWGAPVYTYFHTIHSFSFISSLLLPGSPTVPPMARCVRAQASRTRRASCHESPHALLQAAVFKLVPPLDHGEHVFVCVVQHDSHWHYQHHALDNARLASGG